MYPNEEKLQVLADLEGYESIDAMLEASVMDSVVPAICTNEDCDYCDQLEPDARNCKCDDCGTRTVSSCLIIAGII